MERGRGRGPGPGPSRGLDRVASVLGVGRSVGLGIGPGRAEGVAVQGQSNIGEGPAPPQLSKPGSGRKSTRVGSSPESACALKGAPGGKGGRRSRPSDAVESAASLCRAEPGSGGGAARRRRRRQARAERLRGGAPPRRAEPGSGCEPTRLGPAGRRPPPALQGAARRRRRCQARAEQRRGGRGHPYRTKAGWGRKATRLGSGSAPGPSCARRRSQAVKASPGRSRTTLGRAWPLAAGRSPGRAGSPLGWGPTQVQPARPKTRQRA